MPIAVPFSLNPIDQEEFAQLDYRVMRHAFECQNQLGRLCDEVIYQNDLVDRLQTAGLSAQKEVPVIVTHRGFRKSYSLDLVVANAGIYELKTTEALIGAHEAQLLNYIFLCGSHRGKLVNFRPPQVESQFINTSLTQSDRRQFTVEASDWQERDASDRVFRETILCLLDDWGCWLDVALYSEALIHFAGGEERVNRLLPLTRGKMSLGKQRFHLLSPATAFQITALPEGNSEYEHHLRALLLLSPLRTLHWINLARKRVQLKSLTR